MNEVVFFTGFPGFLGSKLLPLVLARRAGARAVCLVQDKFLALAQRRAQQLELDLELVSGDITAPGLGLGQPEWQAQVVEVYHLAAIYDLAVARPLGLRVNLDGTRNTLDFAAACTNLERFQYVSTCYVSGRYCGIFGETDLDLGQTFNNYYEESKFLAEVQVQKAMEGGLPATIYRPSIVVGDSHTGFTQKYDGPYYLLKLLLRQPSGLALVPTVGDPARVRVNLVPSDFVVEAIGRLGGLESSLGKVYQLSDPRPVTGDELITECARLTGRRSVRVPLPLGLSKWLLSLGPVARLAQVPAASLDYFVHPTHYTNHQTARDLDLEVPHLFSYLPRLIDFLRAHPQADLGALS
ncbi:MAG: SDR family oxidoreductase [Candidatus Eremiobacteraeota bacterium]|nr:SDR family oxidoreductase [Candidatus Eremiobacteraeota bacterium]